MKLAGYFLLSISAVTPLLLLLGASVPATMLLACALALHAGIQVWACGNADWKLRPDANAISRRMPFRVYAWASAASLLMVVSLASRVFPS